MNYHNITHDDMLNGDGLRVVLWVSGCEHNCPECQNPETHPLDSGIPFTEKDFEELEYYLNNPYIDGLTLSGGDPLHTCNRKEVTNIVKRVKELFPEKTIWLYTGYLWEDILELDIIKYLDVVVDGPFILKLKDNNLHWKGSSNQRVIDVKQTLNQGNIILYD